MVYKIFREPRYIPFHTFEIDLSRTIYNLYLCKCFEEFKEVKKHFPSLYLSLPPTMVQTPVYICGWLCEYKLLEIIDRYEYSTEEETIFVQGVLPLKFFDIGLTLFDRYEMIDKESIPYENRHFNQGNQLCTHLDIELGFYKQKFLSILYSAFRLVMEYKEMEQSGLFRLNAFPHGVENATIEFNQENSNILGKKSTMFRKTNYKLFSFKGDKYEKQWQIWIYFIKYL